MTVTAHLKLPNILPGQAQKHITHNEALAILDGLAQLVVLDRDLAAPPPAPATGDRYIVAASPTGAWAAKATQIAIWDGADWVFHVPEAGWLAYLADEKGLVAFTGSVWAPSVGLDGKVPTLGINAAADGTNRLSVKADGALLSHDDVTPGTGDMRLKLNKSATARTASHLFQTGFSGRAEIGLTGDDKFHLKLSADGTAWADVLVADPATGRIGVGTAAPAELLDIVGDNVGTNIRLTRYGANPGAIWRAAGGTLASPTQVVANGLLGGFVASGFHSGGAFGGNSIGMFFKAAENFGSSAQGTYLTLETTPNGSASRAERLRVAQDGNVGIGVTAPAARLDVDGTVKVKSFTVAGLPAAAAGAGQLAFVSNEAGGAVIAFSDGSNWRRVTDRAVVS